MKLTKGQSTALQAINKWLSAKKGKWMFALTGYAGTGKTTLLQELIASLKTPYVCCAPTGKAASVLRAKLPGVTVKTAHQILYTPNESSRKALDELEEELMTARQAELPTARIRLEIEREKERLSKDPVSFKRREQAGVSPGALIIVDEASMVSERMLNDFERTDCRVLFVGDDGQLPPVRETSWFIEYKHEARLEEIVRQALDSPIIRLSMEIRSGSVDTSQYRSGACVLTTKDKVPHEDWLTADQVLTGGNLSRRRINRFFRKRLMRQDQLPERGDKLICLKNDHYQKPPWINGVQFLATDNCGPGDGESSYLLPASYEGLELELDFYGYHCQLHYDETLREEPREMRKGLFEADYAYAVTVHKSQGSEWPFVILADDQMRKECKSFRTQWLYTAVTRAKDRLLIVQ